MKNKIIFAICALACNFAIGATASNTFTAGASLSSSCQIDTKDIVYGDLPFVTAGPARHKTTSDMTVRCTSGTGFTITLSSNTSWQLKGGKSENNDTLSFVVYLPEKPGYVWNEANGYAHTGTGAIQTIPMMGQIVMPVANKFVTPDNYSSTITANLSY